VAVLSRYTKQGDQVSLQPESADVTWQVIAVSTISASPPVVLFPTDEAVFPIVAGRDGVHEAQPAPDVHTAFGASRLAVRYGAIGELASSPYGEAIAVPGSVVSSDGTLN